jgi:RHS repeat-associated protein
MVTDENASVVGRHDYLPFGEEIAANAGGRDSTFGTQDFVNQKFTGQERDAETGLDFFHARYFSAALGRFNSPDPGNAGASLFNPQSWNAYSYVRNNPLTLMDPTGMCDSKDPSCFSIDTSACKWWQIWCWAGGSSGGDNDVAIEPIIRLSLCCHYVTGEPSGPVEQQKPARDFRSSAAIAPKKVPCTLQAPTGNYTVGRNAVARFQPQMLTALNAAFKSLNDQGIVPMITSGHRTAADQLRMRNGASGPNPAAIVSWHQVGMAVDLNTRGGNFRAIINAMTSQELTWGGSFRRPDPPHFQLPPAGTTPPPEMVQSCEAGG